MRYSLFYLFTCAAAATACQPVAPTSMKASSSSPKLTINNDTILSSAPTASNVPPAPFVPPAPSIPSDTLSSSSVDKNSDQTEIDITISTVITGIDTQTVSSRAPRDIKPQMVAIPKTFDPAKIIGFATQILVHDLGKANMIRQEGPIEVWQYRFNSCVVDFFFYPIGKEATQLIAKSWDMRSAVMGDSLNRGSCRAEMDLYHQKIISSS